MRFEKFAISLFVISIILGIHGAIAQDEIIAQAYRTVNVRNGPGTEYAIIGQLNSGTQVQITGRSDTESNWLRIEFESREGWVAYFTVSVLGNAEQLPVVTPRGEQNGSTLRPTATAT